MTNGLCLAIFMLNIILTAKLHAGFETVPSKHTTCRRFDVDTTLFRRQQRRVLTVGILSIIRLHYY